MVSTGLFLLSVLAVTTTALELQERPPAIQLKSTHQLQPHPCDVDPSGKRLLLQESPLALGQAPQPEQPGLPLHAATSALPGAASPATTSITRVSNATVPVVPQQAVTPAVAAPPVLAADAGAGVGPGASAVGPGGSPGGRRGGRPVPRTGPSQPVQPVQPVQQGQPAQPVLPVAAGTAARVAAIGVPERCIIAGSALFSSCSVEVAAAQAYFNITVPFLAPQNYTQLLTDRGVTRAQVIQYLNQALAAPSPRCCSASCCFNQLLMCDCEPSVLQVAIRFAGADEAFYGLMVTQLARSCGNKAYYGPSCPANISGPQQHEACVAGITPPPTATTAASEPGPPVCIKVAANDTSTAAAAAAAAGTATAQSGNASDGLRAPARRSNGADGTTGANNSLPPVGQGGTIVTGASGPASAAVTDGSSDERGRLPVVIVDGQSGQRGF